MITEKDIERFNRYIKQDQDCQVWTAGTTRNYGVFSLDQKPRKAHQVGWMIKHSKEWPKGQIARHTCNNKLCVNPDHIIPGTAKENAADREAIGNGPGRLVQTPAGQFKDGKTAASALNISPQLLLHRIKSQRYPGYFYLD